MSRSIVAGATDYTHQSFGDILNDLKDWLASLKEIVSFLEENTNQLKSNGYWQNTVPFDLASTFSYALKFFQTNIEELTDILESSQIEVEPHLVIRLRHFGKKAHELNVNYGQVWHRGDVEKKYGHPDFMILEKIYAQGRDMAVDLMDLDNVAERLEVFIGKKGRSADTVPSRIQDSETLIFRHERRLQKLKEQKASFGLHAPVHILTEIEVSAPVQSTLHFLDQRPGHQ